MFRLIILFTFFAGFHVLAETHEKMFADVVSKLPNYYSEKWQLEVIEIHSPEDLTKSHHSDYFSFSPITMFFSAIEEDWKKTDSGWEVNQAIRSIDHQGTLHSVYRQKLIKQESGATETIELKNFEEAQEQYLWSKKLRTFYDFVNSSDSK